MKAWQKLPLMCCDFASVRLCIGYSSINPSPKIPKSSTISINTVSGIQDSQAPSSYTCTLFEDLTPPCPSKMRNMEEQTTAMTNRSLRTIRTVSNTSLATGPGVKLISDRNSSFSLTRPSSRRNNFPPFSPNSLPRRAYMLPSRHQRPLLYKMASLHLRRVFISPTQLLMRSRATFTNHPHHLLLLRQPTLFHSRQLP